MATYEIKDALTVGGPNNRVCIVCLPDLEREMHYVNLLPRASDQSHCCCAVRCRFQSQQQSGCSGLDSNNPFESDQIDLGMVVLMGWESSRQPVQTVGAALATLVVAIEMGSGTPGRSFPAGYIAPAASDRRAPNPEVGTKTEDQLQGRETA